MMKNYYDQSMRALQLAGMSERTQQCYTRSVRMLVDFYNKTPDQITEVQLQDYFLHRKNKDKWSPATMRICYSGIKFFFINVLQHKWHTLELIRAKSERRLYEELKKHPAEKVEFLLMMFKWFDEFLDMSSKKMKEHLKNGC